MSIWKIVAFVVGALWIGSAFVGCSLKVSNTGTSSVPTVANTAPSNKIGTAVGDAAPDFQLAELNGEQLKLADLRGQPAVLIFWTAWCPVCKEEAPQFNSLAVKYAPQGVRVVGINIQDSVARTAGGVKEFGIQYRVVRDPDASVTRSYKVTGTPTIIFLDRDGVVRYFGNELPEDYPSRLAALIEQKR
ncbi:MAG: TlpA family protein disulfide reductase [Acidobacteria bacterium]|nr:TlpA family protein disulfide reductase [Acidobacteriota bacterium]